MVYTGIPRRLEPFRQRPPVDAASASSTLAAEIRNVSRCIAIILTAYTPSHMLVNQMSTTAVQPQATQSPPHAITRHSSPPHPHVMLNSLRLLYSMLRSRASQLQSNGVAASHAATRCNAPGSPNSRAASTHLHISCHMRRQNLPLNPQRNFRAAVPELTSPEELLIIIVSTF